MRARTNHVGIAEFGMAGPVSQLGTVRDGYVRAVLEVAGKVRTGRRHVLFTKEHMSPGAISLGANSLRG